MSPRVRFAPSPTGSLHLGTARTAVVNWLFARSQGGELVLRFDDTDRERSSEQSAEELLAGLEWLGIDWDGTPVRQSERQSHYEAVLGKLAEAELTYVDDDATYLRVPKDLPLSFDDLLRGAIEFPPGSREDFVVRRSDGSFTYNFATAVDDSELGMTHVIRGEDHISNTPLQRLVIEGMGETPPEYLHLPLLLEADGSKLSKRHGAVSIAEYRDGGYLPEALLNYLALVSYTPPEELHSPAKLVESFEIDKLHRSSARFDLDKLRWLSGQHIRGLSVEHFGARVGSFLKKSQQPELVLTALQTAGDTLVECAAAESLFTGDAEPDDSAREALHADGAERAIGALLGLVGDSRNLDLEVASMLLQSLRGGLTAAGIKPRCALRAIRAALTGRTSGPELIYFIAALPREEIVRRLRRYV